MKTILLFTAAFLSVFIFSCSKPVDEVNISVTSVNPQKGRIYANIQITGSGFSALVPKDSADVVKVYFGSAWATPSIISDTQIQVDVPFGATSGPVCVEWRGKRYCSPQSFTVLPGNTSKGTFMRMPAYPGHYAVTFMFAAGTSVYVCNINDFWRFNTETFQWTRAAKPPEWASRTAPFTINGKAYIFGGLTPSNGNGNNQLWQYDPQSDQWTVKTPMPAEKRYNSIAFVHNDKVYIAGGHTNGYGSTVPGQLWEYNPATDQWTRKADLLAGTTMETWVYRLRNKFYLQVYNGTLEYDPQTGGQRLLNGFVANRFGAIHSSERWDGISYVLNGERSNAVVRVVLGADNQTLLQQTMMFPIEPGTRPIRQFASIGDELFFFSQDINGQQIDFWEYLPD